MRAVHGYLLRLVIMPIFLSCLGCRSRDLFQSKMEIIPKTSVTIEVESSNSPYFYYKKNNPATILILCAQRGFFPGEDDAWLVHLPSIDKEKIKIYNVITKPGISEHCLDRDGKIPISKDYVSAGRVHCNKSDPASVGLKNCPWLLTFNGVWDKRTEHSLKWSGPGGDGFNPGHPNGIRTYEMSYFDGDIVICVGGNPILKQHVENFPETNSIDFYESLEQGLLFLAEENDSDLNKKLQCSIIQIPAVAGWRMPPDWAKFTGECIISGIKTSSGRLAGIEADIGIELKQDGDYTMSAALHTNNGKPVAGPINSNSVKPIHINAGHSYLKFRFAGYHIDRAQLDGPYVVRVESITCGNDTIYSELTVPALGFCFNDFKEPWPGNGRTVSLALPDVRKALHLPTLEEEELADKSKANSSNIHNVIGGVVVAPRSLSERKDKN